MSTKIETVSNVNNTPAKSRLTIKSAAELLGRVLIAGLFLLSGIGKITAYTATAGYMTSVGVPGVVLPLVIITEVFGSIAIMLGWRTRIVSFLLAGFTLLTGIFSHQFFRPGADDHVHEECIDHGRLPAADRQWRGPAQSRQ